MEPQQVETSTAQATPQPSTQRPSYWRWIVAAAALAAAVTGGAFAATSDGGDTSEAAFVEPTTTTSAPTAAPAAASDSAVIEAPLAQVAQQPLLLDAAAVGEKVIPSVVTVQVTGSSFNGQETVLGSGSGVVYDSLGHIITNDHVVTAGSSYEVVLADGRIYPAEVVGTDPSTDLAVLSVTAEDLQAIAIGDTDALTVGEPAVAVGSPLGLDGGPSLTVGVLSAFGRQVQTDETTRLYGMLQTDAPITSGSSGGALVDGTGRLIGITTAIGVSSVGVEGIGFATPSEIVTRVADEIIETGSASSPYLGIFPQPALDATADGGSIPIGIEVAQVEPDTPAEAAGIARGDVIASIEGLEVRTFNDLVASLRRFAAGDTIKLILGGGDSIEVTLGEYPDDQ